ncbi:MAG: ABC transporter ATP-binding protein [Alloprevotella sp.]
MLTLHDLHIGYRRHTVCRHLTASLPPGRLVALLGTNGCGKSTLLRTLAGLLPPLAADQLPEGAKEAEAGEEDAALRLDGKPLSQFNARQLARRVSVVLTFKPEAEALTAGEVVEMGRIPHAGWLTGLTIDDRQQVERALRLTDTLRLAHRQLNSLSDGERQRVFIAKALAQDAPVILLDEPTAFLDFPSKIAMLHLLRRLAHQENKAILLSTHDVEPALQLADTLWLLRPDGILTGSPQALAAQGDIAAYFEPQGMHFDAAQMRFSYR